jgi:BASS family bile acid:Na+ symporter
VVAAAFGVGFPAAASSLRSWVPVMLAGQVAGVALTISATELAPVVRRAQPLVIALGAQWVVMPAVGYALFRLAGENLAGQGALITAISPAEITSALVAVIAGADAATAAALMTASVALGCVLTPLWLTVTWPRTTGFDLTSLVFELVLSVAVPLLVGVTLRSRVALVAAHPRRCLDLAGLSLILVVFVGAGQARPLLLSGQIGEAAGLAAALVAAGAILAAVVAVASKRPKPAALAIAFPLGMREFGIATAVALAVAPRAAGFGGLYGVLLMLASTTAAASLRPRSNKNRSL